MFGKEYLNKFRSLFLNGILVVLPVTLTALVFIASFRLIKKWLSPVHALLPDYLEHIPHSEIVTVTLFILLVGAFAKSFFIKPIIHSIEHHVVLKIPFVKTVYAGIKQLVSALTSQDQMSFNTVVMAEFPSEHRYCLGFLTGKFPPEISPDPETVFYNIYIPTTPNPTTGYFVLLQKDKFKVVTMTRQEAMAIIISGGIITPERFTTSPDITPPSQKSDTL